MTTTSSKPSAAAISSAALKAAKILKQGGLIAYPTEAVWGLGCDPFNEYAVQRLLLLKQRSPNKGLIVIAATKEQLEPWLTLLTPEQHLKLEQAWPGPYTFLVPDNGFCPSLVRGQHSQVALRVSAHPQVQELCLAFGGPVVSTSANISGQTAASQAQQLAPELSAELDFILPGSVGNLSQPTTIQCLTTGKLIRS